MSKHAPFILSFFALLILPAVTHASDTSAFIPLTSIPGIPQAASSGSLPVFLNSLYKISIGAAAVIAVLKIVQGGITYMLGDSVTEKREARHHIAMAVLGLVLVLSPALVFGIINPKILDLSVDVSGLTPPAPAEGDGVPDGSSPNGDTTGAPQDGDTSGDGDSAPPTDSGGSKPADPKPAPKPASNPDFGAPFSGTYPYSIRVSDESVWYSTFYSKPLGTVGCNTIHRKDFGAADKGQALKDCQAYKPGGVLVSCMALGAPAKSIQVSNICTSKQGVVFGISTD